VAGIMKLVAITLPDGSRIGIPVDYIAGNRAECYADKFGGIVASMEQDTLPLFEKHPDEIISWVENMELEDFNGAQVVRLSNITMPHPYVHAALQDNWASCSKELVELIG